MRPLHIITTKDGSPTLFSERYKATYHSIHGAIQESEHVFIKNGLEFYLKNNSKKITIFEMGFGTGLNCWLSLKHSKGVKINYETVDLIELDKEVVKELAKNYLTDETFLLTHSCDWNKTKSIIPNFHLTKHKTDILKFNSEKKFDIIYFDAFAPETQPELWSREVLQKMYDLLSENGILLTYCAKGSVKRLLKEIGFKVETLPGPPGKREMIRVVRS